MAEGRLQWHPAFSAAFHIELNDELENLYIEEEHMLSKKLLQIDMLIIKKDKEKAVRKNIGRIFREHNIVEYKEPDDYLSLNDFYKVYGYACLYQSDTEKVGEIDPKEITITFVCNHYPRKVIKHIGTARKIRCERQEPGIYYLIGDMFPMQILVTKELPKKENYWLQSLRNNLKAGAEIQELLMRYERKKHKTYYPELMDLIVRANWELIKEEKKMCEALKELFADELKESEEKGMKNGLKQGMETGIKQGMESGLKQGLQNGLELAKNIYKLFKAGASPEKIAEEFGLSVEQVREMLE